LCIDLESMRDDFEHTVDRLIDAMRSDDELKKHVLESWRNRTWTVRPFSIAPQQPVTNRGGSRFTGWIPVGPDVAAAPAVTGSWSEPTAKPPDEDEQTT
jgi:hypothetical protein